MVQTKNPDSDSGGEENYELGITNYELPCSKSKSRKSLNPENHGSDGW